ncbi:transglycosylase SLT domain-containing protein [Pontibacter sp. G13]|uniref:transglycosylase SLT domain-containing protein n=1 Tax=Pontibacter sp. G13 TaxID=3074898 RepID=UPI00288BA7FA|nr:transglycosylase SLT domain-containing protein [Pontibacter sp. G13]WNJ21589.1 transglycosylase SLT domain-containing protein [Pontibacter sp. G13]
MANNPYPPRRPQRQYVTISLPRIPAQAVKPLLWIGLLIGSNLFTSWWMRDRTPEPLQVTETGQHQALYLMEKANRYVSDPVEFELRVREIGRQLHVAPEWLMAVMYAESSFNASVSNRKGSGAVGLIQFMPQTAKELQVTTGSLRKMTPEDQLDYVHHYFQMVRERYGDYESLTDLYLAVLYPRARTGDQCYTLYAKPSKAYRQNAPLDENRDGSITVSDIDLRMRRLFPAAYQILGPPEVHS